MLLSKSYKLLCHPAAKLMANFFVRDAIYVERRAQDSFKSSTCGFREYQGTANQFLIACISRLDSFPVWWQLVYWKVACKSLNRVGISDWEENSRKRRDIYEQHYLSYTREIIDIARGGLSTPSFQITNTPPAPSNLVISLKNSRQGRPHF